MEYLKHGGRIGKVASVAGSLLGIKPIITLKEGEIFPSGIGRSRRKTVDKNIDLLLAYLAEEKTDIADYSICIGCCLLYTSSLPRCRVKSNAFLTLYFISWYFKSFYVVL